jgi:hypothetical protein
MFGLLCLHLLLPVANLLSAGLCMIPTKDQSPEDWAEHIKELSHRKSLNAGSDLFGRIYDLIAEANITPERQLILKTIVKTTIQPPNGKRVLPWDDILPFIETYLSQRQVIRPTSPCKHKDPVLIFFSYRENMCSRLQNPLAMFADPESGHPHHPNFDVSSSIRQRWVC